MYSVINGPVRLFVTADHGAVEHVRLENLHDRCDGDIGGDQGLELFLAPPSELVAGAVGGATAGAGMASALGMSNPYSAALIGGLGLLGYMG